MFTVGSLLLLVFVLSDSSSAATGASSSAGGTGTAIVSKKHPGAKLTAAPAAGGTQRKGNAWPLRGALSATANAARRFCMIGSTNAATASEDDFFREVDSLTTQVDDATASEEEDYYDCWENGPQVEAHPLRMEAWKIHMRYCLGLKKKVVSMRFLPNGDVLTADGRQGKWKFDIGGLQWDVYADGTIEHHSAELHWNIFGAQPRMYRGSVTRDRYESSLLPRWLFRPVIATFTAFGEGDDTADTSYRYRQGDSQRAAPPSRFNGG